MAYPTGLNGQITDAVTQSLMTTTASAPSLALGQLYQTTAHALGLAAQNAVASQSDALALTQATLATLMHELTARRPRADAE